MDAQSINTKAIARARELFLSKQAPKTPVQQNKAVWKNQKRIAELKKKLADTDYQAIKYAEGELSAEEYAETREQRKAWRAEINALEAELEALEK